MRERVEKLRESDDRYGDSVRELALEEDAYRKALEDEGVSGGSAERLADRFSDETLKRIEAEKEKWIDGLTGLRNRNALEAEVPQLFLLERREDRHCAVLMVDFDYFKQVNDTYGHAAGDETLKKMAGIISESVRASDTVYRFGGEEFAVFLPGATSSDGAEIAERIRSALEHTSIEVVGNSGQALALKGTVSIGCTGTDQMPGASDGFKDDDPDKFVKALLGRADAALYQSKESGRNRVTVFREDMEMSEK